MGKPCYAFGKTQSLHQAGSRMVVCCVSLDWWLRRPRPYWYRDFSQTSLAGQNFCQKSIWARSPWAALIRRIRRIWSRTVCASELLNDTSLMHCDVFSYGYLWSPALLKSSGPSCPSSGPCNSFNSGGRLGDASLVGLQRQMFQPLHCGLRNLGFLARCDDVICREGKKALAFWPKHKNSHFMDCDNCRFIRGSTPPEPIISGPSLISFIK